MQVELRITRRDIAWLNISKLFRLKPNINLLVIIVLGVSFFAWRKSAWTGAEIDWVLVFVSSLGGFAGIFLISLVFVLVSSTSKSGVISDHTFTIEDVGLREQTDANDTLNYWSAIKKIEKARAAIYVQINPWLFYVLPRRAFGSDQRFEAFFAALVAGHKAGAPKG